MAKEARKELKFKLTKPINVDNGKGQFEDTHELIAVAPSMRERAEASRLTQLVEKAKKTQETEILSKLLSSFSMEQIEDLQNKGQKDVEIDSVEQKGLGDIIVSCSDDLEAFYKAFDELAMKVTTVVDGVYLRKNDLEQMEYADYQKFCVKYLENFISR